MAEVWWISYADPDRPTAQQFLGANIVRVMGSISIRNGFAGAIAKAHLLHINPGGQAEGELMDEAKAAIIPEEFWHKLLSREDIARLTDALRDLVR